MFNRVYAFASCVCRAIRPTSVDVLARKWSKWTRKQNRTLEAAPTPRPPISQVQDQAPDAALSDSLSPLRRDPVPLIPTVAATAFVADAHSAVIRPQLTSTSAATGELAPATTVAHDRAPVTAVALDYAPVALAVAPSLLPSSVKTQLQEALAAVPPGTHGKWQAAYRLYKDLCPDGSLSENALRLRLSARKRQPKRVSEALPTQPSVEPDRHVRIVSCDDCQRKKRKCGPHSNNTRCKKRVVVVAFVRSSSEQHAHSIAIHRVELRRASQFVSHELRKST